MSNKYEEYILKKLLDKYNKSILSKRESSRNIKISMPFDSKNMRDYVSSDSYLYIDAINEAIDNLVNKNFISVEKDKYYNYIEKVTLNIENLKNIYKYLNLDSFEDEMSKINSVISEYYGKCELVNWFCNWVTEMCNSHHSTKKYFSTVEELREILFILYKVENQKDEISRRSFSAKYLKDSKRLDLISGKIESIIKECKKYDDEDVLNYYNIYKNPTFVYIKGVGCFKINNQVINLNDMKTELILSTNHLKELKIINLNCKEVITVENLDSFYNYPIDNNCIIYLGGFHNKIRKDLLCKIKNYDEKIIFYHSGDIDVGGFYILNHLIEDTNINFLTKKMDVFTLEKYKDFTRKLTEEDKRRLKKLKKLDNMKQYIEVLEYMDVNNVKLEQENIDYKVG